MSFTDNMPEMEDGYELHGAAHLRQAQVDYETIAAIDEALYGVAEEEAEVQAMIEAPQPPTQEEIDRADEWLDHFRAALISARATRREVYSPLDMSTWEAWVDAKFGATDGLTQRDFNDALDAELARLDRAEAIDSVIGDLAIGQLDYSEIAHHFRYVSANHGQGLGGVSRGDAMNIGNGARHSNFMSAAYYAGNDINSLEGFDAWQAEQA